MNSAMFFISGNKKSERKIPTVVWHLALITAFMMTGFGIMLPLVPLHSANIGATAIEIGVIVALFFAGRLLAYTPARYLLNRYGCKWVIGMALCGYTAVCIGYALFESPPGLMACRVVHGVISGLFSVASRLLINNVCTYKSRSYGQSLYSAGVSAGFVFGPLLGATISGWYSIPAAFGLCAGISAIITVSQLFLIPGKATIFFKAQEIDRTRIPAMKEYGRGLKGIVWSHVAFAAALSVVKTLFPLFAIARFHDGLGLVGISLTISGVFGIAFSPVVAAAANRISRASVMCIGAILTATEGLALVLSDSSALIIGAFAVGGIGVAAFLSALHTSVADITNCAARAGASSRVGLAGEVGGVIGSIAAVIVAEMSSTSTAIVLQPFLLLVCLFVLGKDIHSSSIQSTQPLYTEE